MRRLLPLFRCLVCLAPFFAFPVCAAPAEAAEGAHGMYPEWARDASIYEVNVRQFSEAGDFAAVTEYLPRLKEMGVEIVWLMPVHPIGEKNRKGELGSYYSVRDYTGINPEFGTKAEFARLVKRAHGLGLRVILDWVANHTAWDHYWTVTRPGFYERGEDGGFVPPVPDWSDVIALDYGNPEMREAMIDAMVYWVETFAIDGFRCDVAEEVPTDFWNEARRALNEVDSVFMLAEGQLPEFHEAAFEMSYAWHQMGEMRKLVAGEITAADLADYEMREQEEKYPPEAIRMKFLTNHDENSWHATVREDYGEAAEVLRVYTVASRGMPLIYNGEEAGLDKQLAFFEKDVIDWRPHPARERITRLLQLKKRNRALWNGEYGGDVVPFETDAPEQVWAFYREKAGDKVVALLNLSPERVTFTVKNPALAGTYRPVMAGDGETVTLEARESFTLKPWGYRLLEAR